MGRTWNGIHIIYVFPARRPHEADFLRHSKDFPGKLLPSRLPVSLEKTFGGPRWPAPGLAEEPELLFGTNWCGKAPDVDIRPQTGDVKPSENVDQKPAGTSDH